MSGISRFLCFTGALGALLFGCAYDRLLGGAGTNAKNTHSATESSTPHPVAAQTSDSSYVLRVGPDRVEAASLWADITAELREQAETLTDAGYGAFLERRAAQLVMDVVAETLLYQRASQRVPDQVKERVESLVDADIRRQVTTGHEGIERRYVNFLNSRGQTLEQVREKKQREYIIAAFLEQEIKPKIPQPTRDELLAAYNMLADAQTQPERRRMSLIDVRLTAHLPAEVNDPTREQMEAARDAARSKAETALSELQSGLSFSEVAKKYSNDLHAADGGAWGWVTRGIVRERFEPAVNALFDLEAGALSGLIESNDGFMIVRCDEIDREMLPDFQSLQPKLEEQYSRGMYNRYVTELIAELREGSHLDPQTLEQFHKSVVAAAPPRSSFLDSH